MGNKRKLLATCAALATFAIAGCASQPGTSTVILTRDQLNDFEVNCKNKNQQIEFLSRQMPNPGTVYASRQMIHSAVGLPWSILDGSYQERRNISDGWNQAIIRNKINYLQTFCP